jgi:hypothetical protein
LLLLILPRSHGHARILHAFAFYSSLTTELYLLAVNFHHGLLG